MKKKATKAESEHMGRVAELGCILCGQPAQVHHLREGKGMKQRSSHWMTVPLCDDCHNQPIGFHGDKSMLRIYNVTEMDMLAMTIKRLMEAVLK